ncbi:hypothetical protein [Phycicoccus sp. Soil748]|uniref:hypothetical protein n=1 Tax=Phycicoccus sp. Soil748 TaxID=1736397 RepID=UPI000A6ACB73|nr:hypothetical protein [Phycicoccus sp. Soil748]
MSPTLVWANVMRPRTPLVYLDLNTIIYTAKTLRGDRNVPAGYDQLYEAALRAKTERRAAFPLGESHLWEITKITDPKQRRRLADVLESLSDFNYLLGRVTIAELEFDAGMAKIMGEEPRLGRLPLLRPTFGQVFGMVGGINIRDANGRDGSDALRSSMKDTDYFALRARLNLEAERHMLRGPSDDELVELRKDPNYRPEVAVASHRSRVDWEVDGQRVLSNDPRWRRGRLRDAIAAREVHHEWNDMLTRMRVDRLQSGLPPFDPDDETFRSFVGSMPHTQVAISIKTRMHKNPRHTWTPNDISDIDAMSVAYAYCEAVFPDKAVRQALLTSTELQAMRTYVPRRAAELAEWIDALPPVVGADLLVPHPLTHLRTGLGTAP